MMFFVVCSVYLVVHILLTGLVAVVVPGVVPLVVVLAPQGDWVIVGNYWADVWVVTVVGVEHWIDPHAT